MQNKASTNSSVYGFTLIELSIVIVIIGLLIGGILAGQSLIRTAAVRSILADLDQYKSAVIQFKDQYGGLPGDLPDATDYWPTAATCPGDQTTPAIGMETCNGNNNGNISHFIEGNGDYKETYRAWQHLANAGLISGRYTGVYSNAAALSIIGGTNVPRGRIANSVFTIVRGTDAGNASWFASDYGNVIQFGLQNGAWGDTAALKPEEAWNVDTKIDDGKPGSGGIMSYQTATCATSTTAYALDNTTVSCHIIMKLGM